MALLDGELDGRERVLDLVGQPARHLLPGADPLEELDARARLLHLSEHPVEDEREVGELVGPRDGYADLEVARCDLVDRARQPADPRGDAASEEQAEDHRRDHRDPEQHGERLEVAGVHAGALLLELRVRLVHLAGALELVLVPPVERVRGDERGRRTVAAERSEGAAHLELALVLLVERLTPVSRRERVTVVVALHGEGDQLRVGGEEVAQRGSGSGAVAAAHGFTEARIARDALGLVPHVVFDRADVVLVEIDPPFELLLDLGPQPHRRRRRQERVREHHRAREREERGDQDHERKTAFDPSEHRAR